MKQVLYSSSVNLCCLAMTPILFISPMPSITALAPVVAAELGIEILVETSDDEGAVALVQRHPQVEVVVSRGGIAERIKTLPECYRR